MSRRYERKRSWVINKIRFWGFVIVVTAVPARVCQLVQNVTRTGQEMIRHEGHCISHILR
jgi:hypothetical protein